VVNKAVEKIDLTRLLANILVVEGPAIIRNCY